MGLYREGNVWGIDYYDGYKRRRKLVGPSKGEAKKLLARKRLERRIGGPENRPRVEAPLFDEFAERYKQFAQATKRGFHNEKYRIEQLSKHFGKRKLSDLQRWDAEQLKIELSKTAAPATVNRLLGNLKHMMTMAVAWDLLPSNPFTGLKLLRVPKCVERTLNNDEEVRLLSACDQVRGEYLRSCIVLALNTGMRKGEILGLQWSNVDLESRIIALYNGKTAHSDRRIPMNESVFELLSSLKEHTRSAYVFQSTRND